MDPEEVPSAGEDEDAVEEPTLSTWGTISEVAGGILALLLLSVFVLVLYVAGGVVFGLVAWAAPAILAIGAAIVLARYLSRRSGS